MLYTGSVKFLQSIEILLWQSQCSVPAGFVRKAHERTENCGLNSLITLPDEGINKPRKVRSAEPASYQSKYLVENIRLTFGKQPIRMIIKEESAVGEGWMGAGNPYRGTFQCHNSLNFQTMHFIFSTEKGALHGIIGRMRD